MGCPWALGKMQTQTYPRSQGGSGYLVIQASNPETNWGCRLTTAGNSGQVTFSPWELAHRVFLIHGRDKSLCGYLFIHSRDIHKTATKNRYWERWQGAGKLSQTGPLRTANPWLMTSNFKWTNWIVNCTGPLWLMSNLQRIYWYSPKSLINWLRNQKAKLPIYNEDEC